MADNNVAQSIIDMGKTFENLKELKQQVEELKTEKANLERSLNVIKSGISDANAEHDKKVKEHKDEIARLDKVIDTKKSDVNTLAVKYQDVINKHQKAEKDANDAITKALGIQAQNVTVSNNLSKTESGLNNKLEILKQIKELADKL